jgi:predicted SAM-dependent methyltransferase
VKLNLGSGNARGLEGYVDIDKRKGTEVYPLSEYGDGTVEEVRASHILEHFSRSDVPSVLKEWVRVLQPGGVIKIAVPDFDWIAKKHIEDPEFDCTEGFVYGGPDNEFDFHKSLFTESKLRKLMADVGLVNIERWRSEIPDCAAYQVSLNLKGVKLCQRK